VNSNKSASTVRKFGFLKDQSSARKFLSTTPKTSARSSANMTSVTICLLMTCNVYAVANQLMSHMWSVVTRIENCVAHVCTWCAAKRLQLNADKTDILWFGSAAKLRKLSADELYIRVGQSIVKPVTAVRNLGVLINAKLSLHDRVLRLVQSCFFHLRHLHSVHRQLGQDITERLVCTQVLSRLDYCNVVLAGLPALTLAPLQRVLHVAAWSCARPQAT